MALRKHSTKTSIPRLLLLDVDRQVLYSGRLDAFPFSDAMIVQESIAFFQDPEPCEIHRRAVQLRLCAEISQALENGRTYTLDELPPRIQHFFDGWNLRYIHIDTDNE